MKSRILVPIACLTVAVACVCLFVTRSGRNISDPAKEIDWEHIGSIFVKMIPNNDLEQPFAKTFELPANYRELLLALVGRPVPLESVGWHENLCELAIRDAQEREIVVTVIWEHGTQGLIYEYYGRYFSRGGHYFPVDPTKDEYIDEAAALTGFLRALNAKDAKKALWFEARLRKSVGLADS
jgi:hypothetical protein